MRSGGLQCLGEQRFRFGNTRPADECTASCRLCMCVHAPLVTVSLFALRRELHHVPFRWDRAVLKISPP